MGKVEKINEAKSIFDIELKSLLLNKEEWQKFLDFSSEFYKYSFTENLLMFAQRQDVTMCATLEQWNSINRWVKKGSKGIRLIDDSKNDVSLKYVFDITDTYGNSKILSSKWNTTENEVIKILSNYFEYENIDTLENIVAGYISYEIDNNELLGKLSEEEIELVLNPEFMECLIKSATYQVAKRCNIQIEDTARLFREYENITNVKALNILGVGINKSSTELLRIIEYKVKQNLKEEKNYEIKKIWNDNQEELGGVVPNQIQRVDARRHDNGQIIREGTGDNFTEGNNRETIAREESKTSNERISSNGEIQSNDRDDDRGTITTNVGGENLNNIIYEGVEQSTLFSLDYSNNDVAVEETILEKINYKIPNDFNKNNNLKLKYKENIDAIKLLQDIEFENRLATAKEQEILAKYNGWGGLSKVFDENSYEYKHEYQELIELLADDEYKQAKGSVLNAFYTEPFIIDSIYKGLEQMGFKGGNILEPSARSRKLYRKITY